MSYIDMENIDANEKIKADDREYRRKEKELHEQETENTVTTLRVKKKTRDQLSKLCTKGMSFNEAIVMLLEASERALSYHKREKID